VIDCKVFDEVIDQNHQNFFEGRKLSFFEDPLELIELNVVFEIYVERSHPIFEFRLGDRRSKFVDETLNYFVVETYFQQIFKEYSQNI